MYYFIINPRSRSNRGLAIWKELEVYLKDNKINYQYMLTEFPGHATELASKWSTDFTAEAIIILGGDGTINEVINGISDFTSIPLAYIPTGSSNDFARSMKLPAKPIDCLKRILNYPVETFLDVGMVTGENTQRYFMVSSGIGFDASVCKEAMNSRVKNILNRIGLGKITYFAIALKQLICTRRACGSIRINEHSFDLKRLVFASAQNHPFEGGGFKFCPNAKPDDGILNFIFADDMSKWKVLFALPFAMRGTHDRFKGIHIGSCNFLELNLNRKMPVHVDGEYCGDHSHVTFQLCQERIRLLL